jgi:hypothetical protein
MTVRDRAKSEGGRRLFSKPKRRQTPCTIAHCHLATNWQNCQKTTAADFVRALPSFIADGLALRFGACIFGGSGLRREGHNGDRQFWPGHPLPFLGLLVRQDREDAFLRRWSNGGLRIGRCPGCPGWPGSVEKSLFLDHANLDSLFICQTEFGHDFGLTKGTGAFCLKSNLTESFLLMRGQQTIARSMAFRPRSRGDRRPHSANDSIHSRPTRLLNSLISGNCVSLSFKSANTASCRKR